MNHWWFTTFISLHMTCVVQLNLVSLTTSRPDSAAFACAGACREVICREEVRVKY